jgi:hypothetical protein
LQKDFRKLQFKIIAASQDFHGIDSVKNYFKAEKIKYIDLYYDYQNKLFKAFAVAGLPTAFLIDPNGKVVLKFSGAINWFDEKIRDLILSFIPGAHEIPKNSSKPSLLNRPVQIQDDKKQDDAKDLQPTNIPPTDIKSTNIKGKEENDSNK